LRPLPVTLIGPAAPGWGALVVAATGTMVVDDA
jgi:hypothetical protein